MLYLFNISERREMGCLQGGSFCRKILYLFILFFYVMPAGAQPVFQEMVSLERQNSSVYAILNQISDQTGFFFVYNSEILNPDRRIRLRDGTRPLSSWLEDIIADPSVGFNVIGNYILVYRPGPAGREAGNENGQPVNTEFVIQGRILDESTRKPLQFATVGVRDKPLGITTNSDGIFRLRLPDDHSDMQITVSYLGYRSQVFPVQLFQAGMLDILMETDFIPIQEVMIRYYDPVEVVSAAREKINENYSDKPVYLLNFYREGVMRGNRFINYSEALFQTYKSPPYRKSERDQVRLLQSRNINNIDQTDTLILKIRAGVRSALDLDFIKNTPDFLNAEYLNEYDYTRADVISMDGNRAYAIAFEQKKNITDPLYKGVMFIDMESLAFLGADFEVNPKHINKAHDQFIARRNRSYRASVEKAAYTVSYRYFDGHYYLNHVRADLHLRYRGRYQLFSNNYQVFVEMATTRIERDNVTRFDRRDVVRTNRVFFDENHKYDPEFWSNYSIIAPEKHITQAISLIESEIESFINDKSLVED
jgi:hypothetical protein